MSTESKPIVMFSGVVECRRAASGPLGLTLVGRATDEPDVITYLAFAGAPTAEVPRQLEHVIVGSAGPARYVISVPGRDWTIEATAIHVHRDPGSAFYKAIPPRTPPRSKRVFWRLVLALAASPLGRALLARRTQ